MIYISTKILNLEVPDIMEENSIDVICPIHYVDLESFEIFLNTWIQNIPIRKLVIGIGKENQDLMDLILKYMKKVPIQIVEQYWHETLGYCLQELINLVETEYFIFLHADVEILLNWFERMWESRVRGILESLKTPSFGPEALIQAQKHRAYSGAQLILKESVKNLNFADDYVYTNEDIIIQNIILNRGFSYIKTPIYHNHYRLLRKRTQDRETILDWQWRGIIKYAYPTYRLMNYVKGIIKTMNSQYHHHIEIEKEIEKINPKWLNLLK